jgi:hypothetical protein
MSPTEIRVQPNYQWKMGLIALVAMVALYLFLGYLPFTVLVAGGVLAVVLAISAIRGNNTDPCIIIDDKGVYDRRLQVGVIRWEDIRRITLHSLSGAEYISLDLHNMNTYEARRPAWLRMTAKTQRLSGMSPIAISTNGLDIERAALLRLIHQGCESIGLNLEDDVRSSS